MAVEKEQHPEHLGDGAYVHLGPERGSLVLTANHHDPDRATDIVTLDAYAVAALYRYVQQHNLVPPHHR